MKSVLERNVAVQLLENFIEITRNSYERGYEHVVWFGFLRPNVPIHFGVQIRFHGKKYGWVEILVDLLSNEI